MKSWRDPRKLQGSGSYRQAWLFLDAPKHFSATIFLSVLKMSSTSIFTLQLYVSVSAIVSYKICATSDWTIISLGWHRTFLCIAIVQHVYIVEKNSYRFIVCLTETVHLTHSQSAINVFVYLYCILMWFMYCNRSVLIVVNSTTLKQRWAFDFLYRRSHNTLSPDV